LVILLILVRLFRTPCMKPSPRPLLFAALAVCFAHTLPAQMGDQRDGPGIVQKPDGDGRMDRSTVYMDGLGLVRTA
jgi:hypothetical protein